MNKEYSLDWIIKEDIKFYQHKKQFRVNTDTRLLAEFMHIEPKDRVLDIGCNNGALLLAADQKDPGHLYGVEVLKESYETALKNQNFFKHPVSFFNEAVQNLELDYLMDVIVCNPPYFPIKDTHPNTKLSLRQMGRIEMNLTLPELIESAGRLLKTKGRFYFVHRPDRIQEICTLLLQQGFSVKNLKIVYDKRDNQAKSLLIEAIKEGNTKTCIAPPGWIG